MCVVPVLSPSDEGPHRAHSTPAKRMQQLLFDVSAPERPVETQHARCVMEAGHTAASKRKAGVHHTLRCLYSTGRPRFIVLCFTAPHRYCVFHKLKLCVNPVSCKSTGAIFPTAFVHIGSLCHILVILAMFQTLSLLLYLLW